MADLAETIDESGRRIGHHAWVEMRLFETLGQWSGSVPEPRAKALLASQSHHHAWHAELWHALLPALPHLPAADLVAPAEDDAEVVASLAALDDAGDDTVTRLAAIYGTVLPHLIAAYTDHLAHTTIVTDAPTIRALRLTLADLTADLAAGDDLIAVLQSDGPGPQPRQRPGHQRVSG
jgi:hypothetical protein